MSIRAKTKQRLVILIVGAAVAVSLLAGAYVARKWYLNRAAQAARVTGMEAQKKGDQVTALKDLTFYLHRYGNDTEAQFRCGQAREAIEEEGGKHLPTALGMYQRALVLAEDEKPRNPLYTDIAHAVLEVEPRLNLNAETIKDADKLLAELPSDQTALRAKAVALSNLRKYPQAFAAVEQYLKLNPKDLKMQMRALDLMVKQNTPPEQAVARAQALRQANPDDPRFELLLACTYRLAGDQPNMTQWLKAATARSAPDAEFVDVMVSQLDSLQYYPNAMEVLERAAQHLSDPLIDRALGVRLWETGRDADLIKRTDSLDPAALSASVDLLAYRCWALARQNRKPDAQKLADALASRPEGRARAWAYFLNGMVLSTPVSPRAMLETAQTAVKMDRAVGPFHFALGEAYSQLGENELAVHEWALAVAPLPQSTPSAWAEPFLRIAQTLADMGQTRRALEAARLAGMRAPKSLESAITFVMVRAANLANDPDDSADKVLAQVKQILTDVPGEPRASGLAVILLAESGHHDEAAARLKELLAGSKPVPRGMLLKLAQTSQQWNLGLDEECLALYEKTVGNTPVLALAQAQRLAASGKAAEGKKLLQNAMEAKGAGSSDSWKLAWAQYLSATRDPDARAAVTALADGQTDSAEAQKLALRSPAVADDRALLDRSIDRLKSLTGDQGIDWRIARARWLLQSQQVERDTASAVALLREVVKTDPGEAEPRLLLAAALRRQGNGQGAIDELKGAQALLPQNTTIGVELAETLQAQGDSDGAAVQIDQVLNSRSASVDDVRRAGGLLALRGDTARAVEALKKADEMAGPTAAPDLTLALLYRSRNDLDAAEAVCRQALAHNPSPQFIEFAAEVFAARGKTADVQQTLALLDAPGVLSAIRELNLAQFARSQGDDAQLLAHLRKATEVDPSSAQAWHAYLTSIVFSGNTRDLLAAIAAAAKGAPTDPTIAGLARLSDAMAGFGDSIPLIVRPLVASLILEPAQQNQTLDAIKLMAGLSKTKEPDDRVVEDLTRINDRGGPRALRVLITRLQLSLHRWDDAASNATRAMQIAPTDSDPPALAYEAFAGGGHWAEALGVAKAWRTLSPKRPIPADVAIANSQIHLNHPADAAKVIEPYMSDARQKPDDYAQVIAVYAESLVHRGQAPQAAVFLEGLAGQSPAACDLLISLASQAAPDAATVADWLGKAAAAIPDSAVDRQAGLAEAWLSAGRRLKDAQTQANGRALLEKLVQRPDATASAVLSLAMLSDVQNDLPRAQEMYRRYLDKFNPNHALVKNNLAMVLLRRGDAKTLDEALDLANQAVAAAPGVADFHDTQATILAARHDWDKAIAAQKEAARVDPPNPLWRVNLAKICVDGGRISDASDALGQADVLISQGARLPDDARQRLEDVRHAVQSKARTLGRSHAVAACQPDSC